MYDMIEYQLVRAGVPNGGLSRVLYRTLYVIMTAFVAITIPFFGSLLVRIAPACLRRFGFANEKCTLYEFELGLRSSQCFMLASEQVCCDDLESTGAHASRSGMAPLSKQDALSCLELDDCECRASLEPWALVLSPLPYRLVRCPTVLYAPHYCFFTFQPSISLLSLRCLSAYTAAFDIARQS